MIKLFFSYTHTDEELRDRLEIHLTMLKRQNVIDVFHDRRITAGERFDDRIKTELENADIILLLVSSDFLASEYCYSVELTRALKRHQNGEVCVIPIILRVCDWLQSPLKNLMALPSNGKAVTKWTDLDEVMQNITDGIRNAIAAISASPTTASSEQNPKNFEYNINRKTLISSKNIASANLHITKTFSDHDRDLFQRETYEYIERYFENSLVELEDRNVEVNIKFRPIDTNRFVATGYLNGRKVTACTIYMGGLWGAHSISYNSTDDGDTSSNNASLTVNSDNHGLYLEMPFGGVNIWGQEDKKLTQEGAAETFWKIFMEPLQREKS